MKVRKLFDGLISNGFHTLKTYSNNITESVYKYQELDKKVNKELAEIQAYKNSLDSKANKTEVSTEG